MMVLLDYARTTINTLIPVLPLRAEHRIIDDNLLGVMPLTQGCKQMHASVLIGDPLLHPIVAIGRGGS